ncbi:CdaR family transcriptional regulator [Amycolatopsis sp. BJA-103]|uniref:PucR family transcriptional regulator n=1 Tax=Amycolatopsis sp. BJA-103 TaxID=1911175 RepID=UPI0011AFD254|nr:PucR family transcriptional regulator [Amycolatopsis sp. BJA-103]
MPSPVIIAGVPVHETLRNQLDDVVTKMLARHRRDLDSFRRMPVEEMREDITNISRDVVSYYISWLREGTLATPDQAGRIGGSAARRAEEGVPLEALLAAYVNGLQGIFATLTADAGPDDLDAVLALGNKIFEFIKATTGAVASGYLEEVRTTVGQEHNTRRALLAALLRDESASATAGIAGIGLASEYLLLNLAIGAHPDEQETGVNPTTVTRRMLRRLLAVFEAATDDQALNALEATGGIVLVPISSDMDWSKWSETIAEAGSAAGVTVSAAGALTTSSGVAAAAVQTGEILDVLRWFERAPGLYRLEDVLIEYQLTRPGEARDRLADLLAPLEAHPDLFETLLHYLGGNVNRRRIANLLHVHPNTVDYRLRRIHELTGIDVTEPPGIHRATSALAARRAGESG